VVGEPRQLVLQAALVPAGVARRAEEDGALVVVDAVHIVAELAGEIRADFRADEAGGTGDKKGLGHVAIQLGRASAATARPQSPTGC